MMPGLDGIAVLRSVRGQGISTPALFLTAKTEVDQRVEGLDAHNHSIQVRAARVNR